MKKFELAGLGPDFIVEAETEYEAPFRLAYNSGYHSVREMYQSLIKDRPNFKIEWTEVK